MHDTAQVYMLSGRHAGTPITRVPVSYLRWMVNVNHTLADFARAELVRRGSTVPDIEISPHAIDRASQRCLDVWRQRRHGKEGLYAWLLRMSQEARDAYPDRQRVQHNGMILVFEYGAEWPTLLTVMRVNIEGLSKLRRGYRRR